MINFGIANAEDVAAQQGYDVYKGELAPNGAYRIQLKVVKVTKISSGENKGKSRLQIVGVIDDPNYPEYAGCPAFGGLNITDQGVPYVNAFLEALTDGTDAAKAAIKKAFWKTGPITDDAKENIKKIGKWNIGSPKGELHVLVGTQQKTYQGNTTVNIQQYLLIDGENGSEAEAEIVDDDDEDSTVDVEDEDAEGDDGDDGDDDGDPYDDDGDPYDEDGDGE